MPRPVAAVMVLVALLLASCGGDGGPAAADAEPLRIGTKNFPESEIVGQLYTQALEAEGVSVDLQTSVGSTEVIDAALGESLLDMYPEYIGTLLAEVDKISERPAGSREAYELAKDQEDRKGFMLLDPTPFSNENALAVMKSYSRRRDVHSIADLPGLRPRPVIGAATEFQNRFEGLKGLKQRYGLSKPDFRVVNTNEGRQYPKLASGEIDVALVYTTDPQLIGGRYELLSDPRHIFATQHLAPRISKVALARHGPQLERTLNAVSALLTTPVMQRLNAEAEQRTPEQVADAFLRARGLKGS
ncbi:MAG: glycine betaine ABC transporter substrate-binding protein [Solirubrobacteraceae bacterium]